MDTIYTCMYIHELDLYFLILWKDEDDLLDVLEHKMIKLMGDMDALGCTRWARI